MYGIPKPALAVPMLSTQFCFGLGCKLSLKGSFRVFPAEPLGKGQSCSPDVEITLLPPASPAGCSQSLSCRVSQAGECEQTPAGLNCHISAPGLSRAQGRDPMLSLCLQTHREKIIKAPTADFFPLSSFQERLELKIGGPFKNSPWIIFAGQVTL